MQHGTVIFLFNLTHDRAGNNTNVSPYHLHIGKLSDDKPVQLFSQQELKTVGNLIVFKAKRYH